MDMPNRVRISRWSMRSSTLPRSLETGHRAIRARDHGLGGSSELKAM